MFAAGKPAGGISWLDCNRSGRNSWGVTCISYRDGSVSTYDRSCVGWGGRMVANGSASGPPDGRGAYRRTAARALGGERGAGIGATGWQGRVSTSGPHTPYTQAQETSDEIYLPFVELHVTQIAVT